jgi:hypothetical protein
VLSFAGSERVSRRLRATVGAFWGRWHLPLPHKTDIIIAMGPPIPVQQVGSLIRCRLELLYVTSVDGYTHSQQIKQHNLLSSCARCSHCWCVCCVWVVC